MFSILLLTLVEIQSLTDYNPTLDSDSVVDKTETWQYQPIPPQANEVEANDNLLEPSISDAAEPQPAGISMVADMYINNESAAIADWDTITFSDFPPLPNRDTLVEEVLTLGDLAKGLNIEKLKFSSILYHSREYYDPNEVLLSEYPFLSDLTVSDLLNIQGLGWQKLDEMPPIQELLRANAKTPEIVNAGLSLEELLLRYPGLGSVSLGHLDLSQYRAKDIPGFLYSPVITLPDWQEVKVSDVLGLKFVPLNKIGEGLTLTGNIVRINIRLRSALLSENGKDYRWDESIYPFGEFIEISPGQVNDQSIDTTLYFNTCDATGNNCRKIGPFPYLTYKQGDGMFVGDLRLSPAESDSFITKPTAEPKPKPAPDSAISENLMQEAVAILAVSFISLGSILCVVWAKKKRHS